MKENDQTKVEKVEKLEDELHVIYSEVYKVLNGIDRTEFGEEPPRITIQWSRRRGQRKIQFWFGHQEARE